eukprot:TRINITY_DN2432_c0_g1_i1.p1 TRINITY_DN2432_c0_g1~~TRINITY_DN2432_c0_g1_i1.p1  ORF type:complete len:241 (-),score=-12.51 TRINITY_DN2432_c0_g1_i1:791-1513(-)
MNYQQKLHLQSKTLLQNSHPKLNEVVLNIQQINLNKKEVGLTTMNSKNLHYQKGQTMFSKQPIVNHYQINQIYKSKQILFPIYIQYINIDHVLLDLSKNNNNNTVSSQQETTRKSGNCDQTHKSGNHFKHLNTLQLTKKVYFQKQQYYKRHYYNYRSVRFKYLSCQVIMVIFLGVCCVGIKFRVFILVVDIYLKLRIVVDNVCLLGRQTVINRPIRLQLIKLLKVMVKWELGKKIISEYF